MLNFEGVEGIYIPVVLWGHTAGLGGNAGAKEGQLTGAMEKDLWMRIPMMPMVFEIDSKSILHETLRVGFSMRGAKMAAMSLLMIWDGSISCVS